MIAEIYNKLNKLAVNHDRYEDLLTGNFFGALRYLPFDSGIKLLLQNSVYPTNLLGDLTNMHLNEWHDNISFWQECSFERTEPDVVIELDDIVILIEVKLDSGLSSDDANDETIMQAEEIESQNQLSRESRLLKAKYSKYSKKILILLTPESFATKTYQNINGREEKGEKVIAEGVDFGYITWQKILDNLKRITPV